VTTPDAGAALRRSVGRKLALHVDGSGGSAAVQRDYFVYILASMSRRLYIGMTSDLERRVYEYKHGLTPGFTSRYRINRLVHVEVFSHVDDAMRREVQLKGWLRSKKIALIEAENPTWRDLSLSWYIGDEAVTAEE
jgi:putative endonuclease